MAYQFAGRYSEVLLAEDIDVRSLRNHAVPVYLRGTTTPAALFTGRDKATPAPNPTSSDARGNLTFFADPGEYDIVVNGVTLEVTVPADPFEFGGTVDVRDFGAKGDGVTIDSAAINAAIASLPPYAAGMGGGTVFFPPGIYQIDATLSPLTSGVTLKGAGQYSSLIRGTVAGPLLTATQGSGGDPIHAHITIETLGVTNQSANALARAIDFPHIANLKLIESLFSSAGGFSAELRGCIVVSIDKCNFRGIGPEAGLYLNGIAGQGAINICNIRDSSFTDTKTAIRALQGTAIQINGCQFEALAGGATSYTAAISVSAFNGGSIVSNYFESMPIPAMAFYSAIDVSGGFTVGSNFITNPGSPAIDISHLNTSLIMTNWIKPGSNSPNANGVIGDGANCIKNIVLTQHLVSGTGTPASLTGTSGNMLFHAGNEFRDYNALLTSTLLDSLVVGDAWQRFKLRADGLHEWGGGVNPVDTNLFRAGIDALQTDDSFQIKGPRPWADVRAYGAVGDGVANDTAAIQAAITAAGTGQVFFPAGTYRTTAPLTIPASQSGLTLISSGRGAKIINSASDVLSLGTSGSTMTYLVIEGLTIHSQPGGGHVITQAGGLAQSRFVGMRLIQDNGAKNVWFGNGKLYIDILWMDFDFQHVAGATVPGFSLISANGDINTNTWFRGRVTYSGAHFFLLESTSAVQWLYDNAFRDINFEITNGGNIRCRNTFGTLVDNCSTYDLSGATTQHLYRFERSPTAGALECRTTKISHLRRVGGTLGGGLVDVSFENVGVNAPGIIVESCRATSGTLFSIDVGGRKAILTGNTGATITNSGSAVNLDQQAANPDTSGATLAALETEVNELKATLRAVGLIAP